MLLNYLRLTFSLNDMQIHVSVNKFYMKFSMEGWRVWFAIYFPYMQYLRRMAHTYTDRDIEGTEEWELWELKCIYLQIQATFLISYKCYPFSCFFISSWYNFALQWWTRTNVYHTLENFNTVKSNIRLFSCIHICIWYTNVNVSIQFLFFLGSVLCHFVIELSTMENE